MKRTDREYTVSEPSTLLPFLTGAMQGRSRNAVKSYLTHRQVSVNDIITTRHDAPLSPGDKVGIRLGRGPEEFRHPQVRLVYEDEHLIVIDKKQGLLSMGTDKERDKTAYRIVSDHVKKSDPAARIFILHRLDRETSGLMMLARSQEIQELMQLNWKKTVTSRKYVAVVEGRVADDEGTVDTLLAQNRNLKMYVCRNGEEGERAVTRYRVIRRGNDHSLLELQLETGKKNQIRAHMEHIGHPIAGDRKYGAKNSPAGRVCLHASELEVIHPVTGRKLHFRTPIPAQFEAVVK